MASLRIPKNCRFFQVAAFSVHHHHHISVFHRSPKNWGLHWSPMTWGSMINIFSTSKHHFSKRPQAPRPGPAPRRSSPEIFLVAVVMSIIPPNPPFLDHQDHSLGELESQASWGPLRSMVRSLWTIHFLRPFLMITQMDMNGSHFYFLVLFHRCSTV